MVWKKIRNSTGVSNDLQARIIMLRGLTEEGELMYQKDFAEVLKKKLTTINYNIVELKKKGLMTDYNFLTPSGKAVFQKIKWYVDKSKKLRAHKIFGVLKITYPYHLFEQQRNKFKRICENPKYKGFRVEFKKCTILFYSPKKIIFNLPEIFGESVAEIYKTGLDHYINPLIVYLEQMFPGLKVDAYEPCEIILNHVAYQNHPIAEAYMQFKKGYRSERIHVDHSHGVPELETVNKNYAAEDMDRILEYEKIIRQKSMDK